MSRLFCKERGLAIDGGCLFTLWKAVHSHWEVLQWKCPNKQGCPDWITKSQSDVTEKAAFGNLQVPAWMFSQNAGMLSLVVPLRLWLQCNISGHSVCITRWHSTFNKPTSREIITWHSYRGAVAGCRGLMHVTLQFIFKKLGFLLYSLLSDMLMQQSACCVLYVICFIKIKKSNKKHHTKINR